MNAILSLILLFAMTPPLVLFDFTANSNPRSWRVIDDVVMGGRSNGSFMVNEENNGVFQGYVSLENNGGFSSVRYSMKKINVEKYATVTIRLKGDGHRYQFRVKTNRSDYQSYIAYFKTTGEWQQIEIPLASMYPAFRGRKLDMANYPGRHMEEIAFLIGNGEAQEFKLEIDKIELN
jgi:NADH dehydrogenase [ubiquinone] 1 alpha subcomplex assembly factor 1